MLNLVNVVLQSLPWILGGASGLFGLAWLSVLCGFFPWLAPLVGAVLSVAERVFGSALKTRVGVAAIVGVLVATMVYPLAHQRGAADIKVQWELADLRAQEAAEKRDEQIKADAEAAAQAQVSSLQQIANDLQNKVTTYEHEIATRKNAACLLGPDDVRRLRDIGHGKSKAPGQHP
jgi:hypothetical protein